MRGFVQLIAGAVYDRAYFVCFKKRRAVWMLLLCLVLSLAGPHSWAQEKPAAAIVPPPPNVKFTTRLDRTAVWIGDQFHYLIIVEYPTDYEFVLDNLTKETVNMDPLQVVDVAKNVVVQKNNGRKLFVDLTLANFSTGNDSLQIPQFTLYYFEKKKTVIVDQAAAESLTIPGPVIGLRSTLMPKPNDIRDSVTMNTWNHPRWIFPALAWGCGLILIAGLGREVTLFVQRLKARKGPDRRKAMEAVRVRWSGNVPSDFSDSKACLSFYDRSCQDMKEYIGYYMDTNTMGLTAEEMRDEMQRFGAKPDFTLKVTKVLELCEKSRYSGNGASADTEGARTVAQDMGEILRSKL
jgi:hypothetical protein